MFCELDKEMTKVKERTKDKEKTASIASDAARMRSGPSGREEESRHFAYSYTDYILGWSRDSTILDCHQSAAAKKGKRLCYQRARVFSRRATWFLVDKKGNTRGKYAVAEQSDTADTADAAEISVGLGTFPPLSHPFSDNLID
jgi:hypothetical protein